MIQTNKVQYKSTKLIATLCKFLVGTMNLAHITFFGLFICALCMVQSVSLVKLSAAFQSKAKSESSLRRIQRFMAEYNLDFDIIARLIFHLLPHKPPFRLAMDRTNWKFGMVNINVLMLAVVYTGVAFPLMISMLDKRGNSDTQERIDMINRYINLFGKDTIDCLLADREFVGCHWIKYLNDNHIRYNIRIRENFYVERQGKKIKASWLFSSLKCGQTTFLYPIYSVNGQLCYLSASKIKNKQGKPELQIIISFNRPENAQELYKERWQIETAFKALKSSGFNIEDTHLADIKRIERLFSLVMVAFAWAYLVGIYRDEKVKPIKILKHGNRAKSIIKYGLEYIANILSNPLAKPEFDIFKFLSCS
jgi:hypothetical protein